MAAIIINPRCEADRKKCKSFIRIYERNTPENKISITTDDINITYAQNFYFVKEVQCKVSEQDGGDYRVMFKYKEEEFDIWYPLNSPFYEYEKYAFVLRFEAPANFKSTCI
jgi:hypothetical protein